LPSSKLLAPYQLLWSCESIRVRVEDCRGSADNPPQANKPNSPNDRNKRLAQLKIFGGYLVSFIDSQQS
ncbi:MAG: hypothetical protein MJK04_35445, partial [Psychrosphaera sp.]|nr:hypothetical protein [Psychrosphaera sp.]